MAFALMSVAGYSQGVLGKWYKAESARLHRFPVRDADMEAEVSEK